MRYIALAVAFFGIAALGAAPALAERRVALVIGIDAYDNLAAAAQLKKARSDAAAMARAFKDLGFDVIAKDDVTRSAFNSHWQDFLNKLAPGDTAAFYFAGHGVEFSGRTYLIPRDVPSLKPGRDELIRREALSLHEFLADLKEKGTRLNLVILDACRDNPFEQVAGRSVGARRGLSATEPPEGTFIMYSAGAGESALDMLNEADRDPNSVYTRHLLPLLRSPSLSLTDVAEQVRVSVRQSAAAVQHRQTPAYYNQVLGRMCLAGGDCDPRGATATAPAQTTEAEQAWSLTRDTTSTAALEAFIRRFGDSYYGDLAKVRLAELQRAEGARQAAAAQKQAEDTRAKEQAERICTNVEGISNIGILDALASRHKGTPAEPCIAARIDALRTRQVAVAVPPPIASKPAPPRSPYCAKAAANTSYCASSVLAPQFGNAYGPEHLFDGNLSTAWVHGTGSGGAGAWVAVLFDAPRLVESLAIVNGYAKSDDVFLKNARVRRAELVFSDGQRRTLDLADTKARQTFPMSPPVEADWLQLRIVDVYAGSKYPDTAISEVQVTSRPAGSQRR